MPIPFLRKVTAAGLAACLLASFLPLPLVHADATIVVNTMSGGENTTDGLCSLREALKAAISNGVVDGCPAGSDGTDTIIFDQSGTIPMSTVLSDSMVGGQIVIDGAGQTVTVTGTSTMSYLLRASFWAPLSLRNLTLSGAQTGVTVLDNGTLHTENVNFQNFRNETNTGQGIVMATGTLIVTGGTFSGNQYGINISGGTASVSGATFTGNTVRGLRNGSAMLTVSNCVFQENPGGGLQSASNLTAIDSVFTANATSANGAGVLTSGTANLTRCTFTGNTTSGSGGAVYISASSTLTDCTFQDNQAGKNGGAIYSSGLELTLSGNAFIGNQATSAAAGEGLGGALYLTSSWLHLSNSTFSGNRAQNGAALYSYNANLNLTNNTFTGHTNLASDSGSLAVSAGKTVVMSNNLIANTNAGTNCSPGITIATNINNLSTDNSCGSANQVAATDLLLGDLLTYNHMPAVIPLLPGSAAIDAGNNAACADSPVANIDQRDLSRPVGAACDVGAFESRGFLLDKADGDDQSAPVELPFAAPLKVSVTSLADPPEPVNGGRITFMPPTSGASAALTGSPATISVGEVSVTAVANATAGQYTVSASAAGAAPVAFALKNVEEPTQPGPILTVTTLQEHSVGTCGVNDCTLREAMLAANQSSADTIIHFALSGTLTLSAPLPAVLPSGGALTIDGTGQAVIIDGAGQYRIFEVNLATFTLDRLTLTNGQVAHPENDLGDGGAGVYNKGGRVTIQNCTLSNLRAGANTNGGGALFNGYAGTLSIANSLITGSSAAAGDGGAVLNLGQGDVDVINSTFTMNSASGRGGAFAILTNDPGKATLRLTHATLANNSAAQSGGIHTNLGAMSLGSSIFSENAGGNCGEERPGAITNEAGNVTSDDTCPGINAAALLGPLADHGGPTWSMALMPGSPALEAAPSANCPASDQTGAARPNPAGTPCDSGAAESALRPPPRLQLSFTPNQVVIGQAATLTYRVANLNDNGGLTGLQFADTLPAALRVAADPRLTNTCSGTLTASAGGQSVTLSGGSVAAGGSCEVSVDVVASTLGVLTHSAAAVSSVESGAGPVSTPASLTVERWASSLSITAHTPDPSVIGDSITVSVTTLGGAYSSGTPSGQVTVSDGLTDCTVTLANGTGSCALLLTQAGARTLSASYAGDERFLGCASSQVTHTVNKAGVIVSILGRDPESSVPGQSVTVTFSVAPAITGKGVPAGQVTVHGGGQSCSASLSAGEGSCALNLPHAGQIELSAAYAGNDTFAPGVSLGTEQRVNPAATTVSLNVDVATVRYGQAVTLTAAVGVQAPGSGTPTGTVTFKDGATVLGTADLEAGTASLAAPVLELGERSLTATYHGDEDFLTSQGSLTPKLSVLPAQTSVVLTPSTNTPVFGQVIDLTAAISPTTPGGGVPQGTVTFTANGQPIPGCAAVATSQAEAACAYTVTEVGALDLSAEFTGSAAYEGSTDQLDMAVGKALTTLSVSREGAGPLVHDQPVRVAFTLAVQAPGAGQPTGQVSLHLGDATCTVDLAEGGCWLAPSAGGVLSLSGAYSGDEHFAVSSAPGVSLHLDEIFPIFLPLLIH